MKRTFLVLSMLGAVVGCGDDDGPADAGFDGGGDSALDSGRDTGPAVCGDGRRDADEECDDGNDVDTDTCRNDCRTSCGDGERLGDETCDTAITSGDDACPTECDVATDPCSTNTLTGTSCQAECVAETITENIDGDLCCPEGSTGADDSDCATLCGNGVVDAGETCDTDIAEGEAGACPVACDDAEPCTDDTIGGAACSARCVFTAITTAVDGDMCCPSGATSATDDDCIQVCGNGTREFPEQCDDGNLMSGDGCDDMCRSEVDSTAFRLDAIQVLDPHLFISVGGFLCLDGTDMANTALQDSVDSGDLNVLQIFRPLMPTAPTSPTDVFTGAMCTVPSSGPAMCMAGSMPPVLATATNQAAGSCYTPGAGTLTSRYPGMLNDPVGPCYTGSVPSVTFSLAGTPITLRSVRVSATYSGDQLTNGVLAGFITFGEARATVVDLTTINPTLGMPTLFELLQSNMAGDACNPSGTPGMADDSDDFDGAPGKDGWWFYLNFTASEATFSE